MVDLTNPRLIYAKGFLFLLCGLMSASLLLLTMPTWRNVILLSMTVWCFCRCYYFAFYVIEHYVDGRYRFAGLFDFAKYCMKRRNNSSTDGDRTC
ncbi:MAG TPA: hypothetical protein EYG03_10910 [Planctomycetes bacterium]|nr:hypothetical protein [Fuerstiella sp.]HIK92477.1 hypothetical protein [Planctomycetota bacterium]